MLVLLDSNNQPGFSSHSGYLRVDADGKPLDQSVVGRFPATANGGCSDIILKRLAGLQVAGADFDF